MRDASVIPEASMVKSRLAFGHHAAIWNNLPVVMLVVPDTGRGPRKIKMIFLPTHVLE
jgi:hypothetical protein